MITGQAYTELHQQTRARLEELEAVAGHVPPGVLAERLVAVLTERFMCSDFPVKTAAIRERVGGMWLGEVLSTEDPEDEEPPNESGHVGRWVHVPTEPEPEPEPEPDPDPEPDPEPEVEPEKPSEPSKPCKTCGETKPLSQFPRNPTYADNHTNKCKDCTREHIKKREQEARERRASRRVTVTTEPEKPEVKPSPKANSEVRRCARGRLCLAYPEIGEPARLAKGNKGDLCFRCEDAREKTALDTFKQIPIIRHSIISPGEAQRSSEASA